MTPLQASWSSLGVGIIFGVMGTISMKLSHGLRNIFPTFCVILFYMIAFVALTFALKKIELSTVYAVWSGVGTVLVATIGILYFNEVLSFRKVFYLLLIVVGVIGIHLNDFI